MHEDLQRQHHIQSSSDRTFGVVMAGFLAVLTAVPAARGRGPAWWLLAPAAAFLLLAIIRPAWLSPLNRAWTWLGLQLARVTNPLVLGVLFYLVFAPFGWVMRRAGADPLRRRRDPDAPTYWRPRAPSGPTPPAMTRQF